MALVNDGLAEISKLTGTGLGGTKFDFIAFGSGTTAVAATQQSLTTEITTNGGSRQGGASTTGSLVTTTFTNDTFQFDSTWTFTGSLSINEFGVFNGSNTSVGDPAAGSRMLLRQVFSQVLSVVNQDTLQLTVKVAVTAPNNVFTLPAQIITQQGTIEGNNLIVTDLGGTRFSAIGTGADPATALAAAATNTRLGSEFISLGLSRVAATVTTTITTVANDTTQFVGNWTATAATIVNEVGIFNSNTVPSTTTSTSGTMMSRHVFTNPLNLVNTDKLQVTVQLINVAG